MASRIALDASSHLEAELAVEVRGLKVVSLQHNLVTVPHPGLLLDRLHQPRAVALLSHVGWDEEIPQIAGAAPTPPIGTADNNAVGPAQEQREQFAVRNAGRLNVELIKALFD